MMIKITISQTKIIDQGIGHNNIIIHVLLISLIDGRAILEETTVAEIAVQIEICDFVPKKMAFQSALSIITMHMVLVCFFTFSIVKGKHLSCSYS